MNNETQHPVNAFLLNKFTRRAAVPQLSCAVHRLGKGEAFLKISACALQTLLLYPLSHRQRTAGVVMRRGGRAVEGARLERV